MDETLEYRSATCLLPVRRPSGDRGMCGFVRGPAGDGTDVARIDQTAPQGADAELPLTDDITTSDC